MIRATYASSLRSAPWRPGGRLTAAALGLALLLLLQGCAGTARGRDASAYSFDPEMTVVDVSESPADAWVILRYPAMIENGVEDAYLAAYSRQVIGGRTDNDGFSAPDADQVAKSMLAKSNYFAMSLYRELTEQLPMATVLLSPHLIVADDQGRLASRPMLATERIPSVVTIDFATYSFPDTSQMMDSPPLTFGDVVTPLAVVHADHWLRPTTHGLLLASSPLIDTAWFQSDALAQEEFDGRLEFRPIDDSRSLDFVRRLNGPPGLAIDVPTKSVNSPRTVGAVENYPLEKILMDGELMRKPQATAEADPFRLAFAGGVVTRVEAALKRADHDRATFSDRQKLMAQFDPALAHAFMAQSRDESVRARLQLAEKLIQAERRFLAAQSRKIYEGVYEGGFGNAMREMLMAEVNLLDRRRELARRQNMQTALAVIAAVGAAYAGSQVSDNGSYDHGMATVADVMIVGAIAAMEAAFATSGTSKEIGENFLLQMAPALEEQITVQVDLVEGAEEITARDHAEFRRQTLAIYQRQARSMTVDIETDCTFRHPASSRQGRWYGACAAGRASGHGYGVVRTDDGVGVEFLGEARDGTANGPGAMIVHAPGLYSATYYEGTFQGGLPHGTLRYEVAGRSPEVRRFEQGVDRGRGDADAVIAYPWR